MKHLDSIREKIEELIQLDKGFAVFGSSRFRYQFNPTLSLDEINQIEAVHKIKLSEEYKAILTQLGNGGLGPGYGLQPLSLKNIHPPYIGTKQLLRNWLDPNQIEIEMIDSDELSGYIKLFDYGGGIEYGLIVTGEEQGAIIYVDCDDRFEKLKSNSILAFYDFWLDKNIAILERVKQKLNTLQLKEVIDSEWALDNFNIKALILSIIDAGPIQGRHSGKEIDKHLAAAYKYWKSKQPLS